MMACLIRNDATFEAFSDLLHPHHFTGEDAGYGLVWKTVVAFYENYGTLPERELLLTEIQGAYDADPGFLNPEMLDQLSELIDFSFDTDSFKRDIQSDPQYTKWAVQMTKKFLDERLLVMADSSLTATGSTVLADLPGFLQELKQESEQIRSVAGHVIEQPFPEAWDKVSTMVMQSTGCDFLNRFLGGGHCPGEVYGVLGPFGSCKTTMAVQAVVETARRCRKAVLESDGSGPTPVAFYVGYEAQPSPELRHRSLSYAARIHRKSLETMSGLSDLSTTDSLKPYERKEFYSKLQLGEKVPGEQDRARSAIKLLNDHVRFVDMTGGDPENSGAGAGFVEEVLRVIDNEVRRANVVPAVIWIDYAGAMVKRYLAATNKDYASNYRHLINEVPARCKTLLSQRFNCPVWVLHQLSGSANSKSPGAKLHHTDAAESKSFGENLDFAFTIGNPNDANLCVLSCTKHRRQPKMDHTIIQVLGELNRVRDTKDEYVVDSYDFKIKRRADLMMIQAPEETAEEFEAEL
jgi:RecA/RadA recombinase